MTRNCTESVAPFRHGNVIVRISVNEFGERTEVLLDSLLGAALSTLGNSLPMLSRLSGESSNKHIEVKASCTTDLVCIEVSFMLFIAPSAQASCLTTQTASDIFDAVAACASVDGALPGVAKAVAEFSRV